MMEELKEFIHEVFFTWQRQPGCYWAIYGTQYVSGRAKYILQRFSSRNTGTNLGVVVLWANGVRTSRMRQ